MNSKPDNQASSPAAPEEVRELLILQKIPDHPAHRRRPRRGSEMKFAEPKMNYAEIEERIATAIGTRDPEFLSAFMNQVIAAGELGNPSDDLEVNFLLSVIEAVRSNGDVAKGMIAAQFAVVHAQFMRLGRYLNHTMDPIKLEMLGRLFNNLARTSVNQYQALTQGHPGVSVGHVSVNGQAIVGNVTHNQREPSKDKAASAQPLLTEAKIAPMPPIEENRERVSATASGTARTTEARKR